MAIKDVVKLAINGQFFLAEIVTIEVVPVTISIGIICRDFFQLAERFNKLAYGLVSFSFLRGLDHVAINFNDAGKKRGIEASENVQVGLSACLVAITASTKSLPTPSRPSLFVTVAMMYPL